MIESFFLDETALELDVVNEDLVFETVDGNEGFVAFFEPFSETNVLLFCTLGKSCVGYLPFPLTTA